MKSILASLGIVAVVAAVALTIFVCIGAMSIAWHIGSSSPGDETNVLPDVPVDPKPVPIVDEELNRFRDEWDIYGRFESWPFVVPLAKMAESVYGERAAVESCFNGYGFTDIILINSDFHTQVACLAKRGDVGIIVFRGTDDTEDWFSNAAMYLHHMSIGDIHTGFSGAYSMLRAEVLRFANDKSLKHVWITGHSLGGAMAATCAIDLVQYQGRPVRGVITFGQPSIGKDSLMTYLDENISDRYIRFANEADIVPRMPPLWSHSGCLFHFQNGKIRKSTKYIAMTASESPFAVESYESVEQLPVPTQNQIRKFEAEYNGNKTEVVPNMNQPQHDDLFGKPLGAAPGAAAIDDSQPLQAIAYVDDHDMTKYRAKIVEATNKWYRSQPIETGRK